MTGSGRVQHARDNRPSRWHEVSRELRDAYRQVTGAAIERKEGPWVSVSMGGMVDVAAICNELEDRGYEIRDVHRYGVEVTVTARKREVSK